MLAEAETNLASLGDAPEAEGRMRLALASAERALGQGASARVHLERTLALSLAHPGFSWRDSARCLELLAELALEDGDGAAALAHAGRRTRLASAEEGQDSEDARMAREFEEGVRQRLGDEQE
ncbi:MAG: hypothetical protein HOP15_09980 [Planctomycetes bacterium]|nr:hypothetical protein [Planctomycetota bacterium]